MVDLTFELVTMLQRHPAWVKSECLRLGRGEPEWLFPNVEGKPMEESRVRKVFKRALKAAALPEFRLYDLRLTYASLLLADNAPITYVSAQLRHANPVDDSPLLRALDPEQGPAGGRPPRTGHGLRCLQTWNQKVEPKRNRPLRPDRSGRFHW